MTDAEKIELLSDCCKEAWGVVNLCALLHPEDLKLQQAAKRVDRLCRKTSLEARVMWFVESGS